MALPPLTDRARRRRAAVAVAALAVGALTACGPAEHASGPSASPPPTPSATASASCSGGSAGTAVAYSSLPTGSFTHVAAEAGGRAIRLPARTLRFHDFEPADGTIDGGVLGPQAHGLIGAGPGRSVLEVAAGTSTRASEIPTAFPATNQLSVLRVAGEGTVLRGFSIRGTDQGHLYNGLRVDRVRGLRASSVSVTGIPGGGAAPPGETFGINDYRTVGSQWSHVRVDGAGVGASGFGVNGSTGIRLCDVTSTDNRSGMGFAFWQASGIECIDCTATDNGRAGFNFERVSGSNELVRPVSTGNAFGIRISSDVSSARFKVVDPALSDGRFVVTLPYRYNGTANRQKASDITLVVDGRVRSDLLRIERY